MRDPVRYLIEGGVRTPEENIFAQYLAKGTVFRDKGALTSSYMPQPLRHREEQIAEIAKILSPLVRGEMASNLLLFGNTGTGKTVTAKYLGSQLKGASNSSEGMANYIYVNCQTADTQYGVLYAISSHIFSKDEIDNGTAPPPTGWSMDRVHQALKKRLSEMGMNALIVLDEIDMFISKSGDDALYSIMKLNEPDSSGKAPPVKVSIMGIANDLRFLDLLDSRVSSRFSSEKVQFPPYNAAQLKEILTHRARISFKDGVIGDEVIVMCASTEARIRGDARKAIDLLRVAGEIADRNGEEKVTERIVQQAYNAIERDYITDSIRSLTTQSKHILLSIALNAECGNDRQTTGDVYDTYLQLCRRTGISPLSQRRVTDLLSEMDTGGLVNARVRSFGRGGRTKEISLALPNIGDIKKVLETDDFLSSTNGFKPRQQTTLI